MYKVWLTNGPFTDIGDLGTYSLPFCCEDESKLLSVIRIAEENGFAVGIYIINEEE